MAHLANFESQLKIIIKNLFRYKVHLANLNHNSKIIIKNFLWNSRRYLYLNPLHKSNNK